MARKPLESLQQLIKKPGVLYNCLYTLTMLMKCILYKKKDDDTSLLLSSFLILFVLNKFKNNKDRCNALIAIEGLN